VRAVGLTAQYLLQAIESRRGDVQLSDPELQHLLNEACQGRVRTTGARARGVLTTQDEREELQEAMERILVELRNYTVRRAEAPVWSRRLTGRNTRRPSSRG